MPPLLPRPVLKQAARAFSTTRRTRDSLRIGYVPEHFSTPLHFAKKYYNLDASLIPFPSGTGHMIQSLKASEIDVGIGLTEGWVAGLGKEGEKAGYKLVGTYVETPLCWAISTGAKREISDVGQLRGRKMGVSRVGSGSYVMGFVLADQHGWLQQSSKDSPFEVIPLNTFDKLRQATNDGTADFFLWEHFTSKRYFDAGEIKRLGELYTPWSSWKIAARDATDTRMQAMSDSINEGIRHFNENQEEAVEYISSQLDYSAEDAREWLGTVTFPKDVRGVDPMVVERTIEVLGKAGVIDGDAVTSDDMVAIKREARGK